MFLLFVKMEDDSKQIVASKDLWDFPIFFAYDGLYPGPKRLKQVLKQFPLILPT